MLQLLPSQLKVTVTNNGYRFSATSRRMRSRDPGSTTLQLVMSHVASPCLAAAFRHSWRSPTSVSRRLTLSPCSRVFVPLPWKRHVPIAWRQSSELFCSTCCNETWQWDLLNSDPTHIVRVLLFLSFLFSAFQPLLQIWVFWCRGKVKSDWTVALQRKKNLFLTQGWVSMLILHHNPSRSDWPYRVTLADCPSLQDLRCQKCVCGCGRGGGVPSVVSSCCIISLPD